ncbi:hypothetical protein RHDE110596_11250 [Prescottella defluvii]
MKWITKIGKRRKGEPGCPWWDGVPPDGSDVRLWSGSYIAASGSLPDQSWPQ